MSMSDREIAALIHSMSKNSVSERGKYTEENERYLEYYLCKPFGDEEEGRSQVISPDVKDLVESDMPSLARVFLGAGDPVEFAPVSKTAESVQEAKERQALVSHIIATCKDSYRTQFGWLKAAEIQKIAALEYGCEEVTEPIERRYKGLSDDELALLISEIESSPETYSVDFEQDDDEIIVKIQCKKMRYFMRNIPSEDFLISANAESKDQAELVGRRFRKTRSELMKDGFSRDVVDSMPTVSKSGESNTIKNIRFDDQGGEIYDQGGEQWATQVVEGYDVYALVDYDGDGIAERRHIITAGHVVVENEPFNHVPYALISSMLMPNNIVGEPRAELAMQYQRVNSVLWRQVNDNIYSVNNPMLGYTDGVDVDSLLDRQLNGVVHMEDDANILPIEIPYIGDKALQVVAFMDGKKQASTGAALANQALQADNLHKETATRFESMNEAASAKIELVARGYAETGFKELWEGIAWFASHYQDADLEMKVLGKELTFNPADWKYEHYVCVKVGTGAGDDEKTIANLSSIYQIQSMLAQGGSTLVDQQKIYNTLAEMVKATGKSAVDSFFNNPEQPDSMVMAERDLLRAMVQQMEGQLMQANPLAEAEKVKADAQIQMQGYKQKFDAQMAQFKQQQDFDKQLGDALQKRDTQLRELQFKYDQLMAKTQYDYTALASAEGNTSEEIKSNLEALSDDELFAIAAGGVNE